MSGYVGIDLGKTGAVGTVNRNGEYLSVHDIPIEVYNGHRWRLDFREFDDLIASLTFDEIAIEDVWANATNGSMAAMGMGQLMGAVEGVLYSYHQMPIRIAPMRWKRHFKLIGKDKMASLDLARLLFPTAPLTRKKDHNRAEALLIARYLYEQEQL